MNVEFGQRNREFMQVAPLHTNVIADVAFCAMESGRIVTWCVNGLHEDLHKDPVLCLMWQKESQGGQNPLTRISAKKHSVPPSHTIPHSAPWPAKETDFFQDQSLPPATTAKVSSPALTSTLDPQTGSAPSQRGAAVSIDKFLHHCGHFLRGQRLFCVT